MDFCDAALEDYDAVASAVGDLLVGYGSVVFDEYDFLVLLFEPPYGFSFNGSGWVLLDVFEKDMVFVADINKWDWA